MKYINTPKDIPTTPHFAALVADSVYIPEDERSRTNPGHGYPAETKHFMTYIVFDGPSERDKWVTEQETKQFGRTPYQIVEVRPMKVVTTVKTEVIS